MALSIGELVGYLDLDAGPFEKGIGKAFDSMGSKKFQVAGAAAGKAAADAIAAAAADVSKLEAAQAKQVATIESQKTKITSAHAAQADSAAKVLIAEQKLAAARARFGDESDQAAAAALKLTAAQGRSTVATSNLTRESGTLEAALEQQKTLATDLAKAQDALGEATGKAGMKMQTFMGGLKVAGAAAGVAAGTAIMAGMLASMETEKLNAKLSASLGLTKPQSAEAGKAAGALYADNYGSSMEDVTGAVEGVMASVKGMKNASSADIQDVTKDVLNLATAFEVDTGRAAQVAGQMITSGIAVDAKNATDLLAGTLASVPKNVREDIMDAVDEYSPFMATLGIKGEEAMGLLAVASEKGMYGIDKTGDALKEFTIRSTDMSKATGGAYDALGMNQADMSAKLLAGGDTAKAAFGEIITGLSSMTDPVAQSQAALALFGTPLEDLSVTEIPNFIGSLDPMGDKFDSLKGKAGELDTTLNAGAKNGWGAFQRAGETAMSSIGEKMLPILTPIIEKMTEWAPILGPLVIALAGFAAIMWVVNAAMLASPITWIILAIVLLIAAVVLLVMNWQQVVDFLGVIWGGFINWCIEIIDGFAVWWNGVWAGVGQFISDVWNNIVNWVTDAINNVSSTISSVIGGILSAWNRFWGDVGAKVGEIWEGIKRGVSDGIDGVVSFVRDLPGKVLGFFSNAGTLLLDAGGQIIEGFLKGLQDGFNAVKDFVGGIGDWIAKNKGPKAYDLALLIPAGGWIMDGLGKGIEQSMPGLKKILGGVSATIATGVTGGTVGLSGIPGGLTATQAPGSKVITNNWNISEQSDPQATAMNVARRQQSLGV